MTGVVTCDTAQPLRNVLEAVAGPRVVVELGTCACEGGASFGSRVAQAALSEIVHVDVDVEIPGRPPSPTAIVGALATLGRRWAPRDGRPEMGAPRRAPVG